MSEKTTTANLSVQKRLLIIIITASLLLFLIGKAYSYGFKKYYCYQYEQIDEAVNKHKKYDIIFVGSSRTHVHIDPEIVDSVTGLHSYNFGIEGARLGEIEMMIKAYLASHPAPRFIVVDLTLNSFEKNTQPFFNPNRYYPFLNDTTIYNALNRYKHASVLKYSNVYRITEADDYIKGGVLFGLLGKKEQTTGRVYKGYMENFTDTLAPCKELKTDYTTKVNFTSEGKNILENIIRLGKAKGCRVILTYAPEYRCMHPGNENDFFNFLKNISASEDILFYNYQLSEISKDNKLFCDYEHLNPKGAAIYTHDLANKIVNLMTE